jgi:hypothetical protein
MSHLARKPLYTGDYRGFLVSVHLVSVTNGKQADFELTLFANKGHSKTLTEQR